ncbi:MAG: glycoside hydrolase family 43 protein [Bacteroidota bacterium]
MIKIKQLLIVGIVTLFCFSCQDNGKGKDERNHVNHAENKNLDTLNSSYIDNLKFAQQPLVTHIYTADPSAHVFEGKLYIYPSHDYESGTPQDDLGSHFAMRDYHVLSLDDIGGEVIDHGVVLDVDDIPWAGKQLWAPDAAYKNGTYYLYFPLKNKEDIFQIGVATSPNPAGPFTAQPEPIKGSFSIDPAIFEDVDDKYYMYFGGIWGGQLQRYSSGTYQQNDVYPLDSSASIMPKIAMMTDDMLQFAEEPKDVQILDEEGMPLKMGDNERRFFEAAWVHTYNNKYYLSYSTGDTHNICYAIGNSPYGPFTYKGIILEPVLGWTNHHSIVEYKGKWYLFYHDSSLSNGVTHLRSVKMTELKYNEDGTIQTLSAYL